VTVQPEQPSPSYSLTWSIADQANLRNAVRSMLLQLNSAVHSGRWHNLLEMTHVFAHVFDTPTGTSSSTGDDRD
jgi:hypothetical protein